MKRLAVAFLLLVAACGGGTGSSTDTTETTAADPTTTTVPPATTAPTEAVPVAEALHTDPIADCRSSFGEGPVGCGPGTDIISINVDPAGPVVLTIEMTEAPRYDEDFQWLIEFSISDLACGITNTSSTGSAFEGSDIIGPYGYRLLTGESAPPGTCDGSLDGTTATLVFNIQTPTGPWTVVGGTQQVEIANLEDEGSSDDVVIDMTPGG